MERKIVLPGEKVDDKATVNTFIKDKQRYSAIYGLMTKKDDFVKIVPLKGKYMPMRGDYVVAIVTDVKHGGCVVDINSPYSAFLLTKREYNYGDVIFAKVRDVDEVKSVLLEDDRKLFDGKIVEILPVKIPRLIGKKNSMLNLIRDGTGCNLFVGRNGRIWVKGENIAKAQEIILKVEKEAHTPGLTERIINMLKESGMGPDLKSGLQEVSEEVTPNAAEKETAEEVIEQIAEQDEVPEKNEGEING